VTGEAEAGPASEPRQIDQARKYAIFGDRPGWSLPGAAQIILLLALWVATHPYLGLVHDARFYSVEALSALEPGRFSNDLFFKYGSQNDFTLFTVLYKHLVAAAGVWNAALVTEIVGQALWLSGAALLLKAIFRERKAWLLALGAVILFYPGYGGEDIFSYGEVFATPRLIAEGLILAGLGLALEGRRIAGALLLVAAAAVHPLMAAGPIGVALVYAAMKDRRVWLVIGAGAAAAAMLVLLRIGPFGRAFGQFDSDWLRIILKRCNFGFISQWRWWEDGQLLAAFALMAVAHALGDARERRMIGALAFVTTLGLAASLIGGDLLHNILAVNLQPWRIAWLMAVIVNALVVVVVLRLPGQRWSRRLFIAAAVACAAARFLLGVELVETAVLLIACAVFAVEESRGGTLPAPVRIIATATFASAGGLILVFAWFNLAASPHVLGWAWQTGLAIAAAALLALAIPRPASGLLLLAGIGLLAGALASAYRVDAWQRYVFSPPRNDGLSAFIAGAGATYWDDEQGLELLWFRAGAPEYYSCLQGSGAMFYRGTAEDYDRRGRGLRGLNTRGFGKEAGNMCESEANPEAHGPNSRSQLVTACRALPDLDTLILGEKVAGLPVRVWRAPAAETYYDKNRGLAKISTFYRYSCADLRG
jgi:hypothetical protein